jgi:hypothetical protein
MAEQSGTFSASRRSYSRPHVFFVIQLALLLEARKNPMLSEVGYNPARIDADLAILYRLAKRTDEADKYFRQARVVAEYLGAKGLLVESMVNIKPEGDLVDTTRLVSQLGPPP